MSLGSRFGGRSPLKRRSRVAFVLGAAGLALGVAVTLHTALALPQGYSPYRKLRVFAKILAYVENNYVTHVDDTRLIHGAINGMLRELDVHSTFLDAQEYEQLKADTQGEFCGVGLEVEIRDGWITVVSPIEGTPADQAGLRSGDRVLAINGESTENLGMHDAVLRMRGRRGTRVRLRIGRTGIPQPVEIALERQMIQIVSVTGRALASGVLYARVKIFQQDAAQRLQELLERQTKKGPLRGLVLDLRNNPGGLLDQAVRVADLFLSEGLIVRTSGKAGRVVEEERAHRRGTYAQVPMVCLINGGSASAAEIVAGALQDQGRALVLGSRSFGKASVQTIIELEDGSALKLTVAHYTTPSGRRIERHGIQPDVVIETAPPAVRPTSGPLRGTPPDSRGQMPQEHAAPGEVDPQLEAAIEHLQTHRR